MSQLLARIQQEQLNARKQKDAERAQTLTTLIGEIQRSPVKIETDEQVIDIANAFIKKVRKEIDEKPYFEGSEKILSELESIEAEFLPDNKLSQEQIIDLIDKLGSKEIRTVMPFLGKYEKEHDVIIDKAFAKQYILQN